VSKGGRRGWAPLMVAYQSSSFTATFGYRLLRTGLRPGPSALSTWHVVGPLGKLAEPEAPGCAG
jgi:hypothetical protein